MFGNLPHGARPILLHVGGVVFSRRAASPGCGVMTRMARFGSVIHRQPIQRARIHHHGQQRIPPEFADADDQFLRHVARREARPDEQRGEIIPGNAYQATTV
jgi:hypothetical protein